MFIVSVGFAKQIPVGEALLTANNYLLQQKKDKNIEIQLSLMHIEARNSETVYYVFENTAQKGFVIVSADDRFYPVLGYSLDNEYRADNQPDNLSSWMEKYALQIEYAKTHEISEAAEISKQWKTYNTESFTIRETKGAKSVSPLCGDILWDQGAGWNDRCPADEASEAGNGKVFAGCVATAMGIILKYWSYPIQGSSSKSYYIYPYGTLSANFATSAYFWNLMPNTEPTEYTALLLYHLGVSVSMMYGPDGSGAYSQNVPNALTSYFKISSSCSYVDKDNYTQYDWINTVLKPQIDAGKPIYYSGSHQTDGGHAFVCSGYDENDYFHFNFGWSGFSNGFYAVTDVNGFNLDNSAVINIIPSGSTTYPAAPSTLDASVNTEQLSQFEIELTWDTPAQTRGLTGYNIYRGTTKITSVGADVNTYTDITTPANLNYAVQAVYSDGVSLAASDDVAGLFYITFRVYSASGTFLTSNALGTKVTFQGITKNTGFGSTSFGDVPYGGQQLWEAVSNGHPTTSGYIDITQTKTFSLYLTGAQAEVENSLEHTLNLYPNPAKSFLSVDMPLTGQISYQIFDISGKLVQSGLLDEPTIQLNNLNSGTYFIQIIGKDQRVVKQFVVE